MHQSSLIVVSRRIRDSISTEHTTYHHRCLFHQLEQFHGFMKLSSYPCTSICLIRLETRLFRLGNVFPVVKSSTVLTAQSERYTSEHVTPKSHINNGALNSLHICPCWCCSIQIRRNLKKYCPSIMLKDYLSSSTVLSFKVFFWPHHCRILAVFQNNWYSYYTWSGRARKIQLA